jgi:ABC-type multidrug transport system fused ATPase/permease subunit
MIYTLGYSALPGFAFVLLLSPTQSLITKHLFSLRKRSMRWTDARVKAITELMSGIRVIKTFAWEVPYLERIATLRAKELSFLRRRLGWRSANIAVAFAVPTLAAVISFITYSATGHSLTGEAGRIFSALTFFQLLRTPLQFLPVSWNAIADATNAARRVSLVFKGEVAPEGHPVDRHQTEGLLVSDASFEWDSAPPTLKGGKGGAPGVAKDAKQLRQDSEKTASDPAPRPSRLENITMQVPRGSLVAIVGPIGSGKSSLISALAGEMRKTAGSVTLGGSLGLCAQSAWILSSTVRNNIIFGKEYDEARYKRVVRDCCLLPDFAMLPDGDQTVVGEKGVSLSGGQRQRVNIARAVYHDDEVILLDDCFSALDAHVGEAVFRRVILGSMRQKTRILATHALHLLASVDYIYTLDGGRIAEHGTYEALMRNAGSFAQYVDKYGGVQGGAVRMEHLEDVDEADTVDSEATKLNDDKAAHRATDREVDPTVSAPNDAKAQDGLSEGDPEKKKRELVEGSKPKALMQVEERNTGSVSKHTYAQYFGAGNIALLLPLFVLAVIVFQGSTILSPLWLLWWQEQTYGLQQGAYMGGYAAFGIGQAVGLLCMGQVFAFFTYFSSRTLHRRALERVAHAPTSFFDTTPLGRITHRFSKDVDVIDNVIGDAIRTFLGTV